MFTAYESKMEQRDTVFDADRHVQYEEMRREMTKLYDDVFRSVSLPDTEIKVK